MNTPRPVLLRVVIVAFALALLIAWRVVTSKEITDVANEPVASPPVLTPSSSSQTGLQPVAQPMAQPVVFAKQPLTPGQPALHPPVQSDLQNVMPHPEAAFIGDGSLTPAQELDVISHVLDAYVETFGALPVGENNAQIMNALRGNNPQYLGLFPYEHSRLDEQGRLRDPWDTPYFFHLISRTEIQIRSAGPDREMYTQDDEVK